MTHSHLSHLLLTVALLTTSALAGCAGPTDHDPVGPTRLDAESADYRVVDDSDATLGHVRVLLDGNSSFRILDLGSDGTADPGRLIAEGAFNWKTGQVHDIWLPSGSLLYLNYPQPSTVYPWGVRSLMPTADEALLSAAMSGTPSLAIASILVGPQAALMTQPDTTSVDVEWDDINVTGTRSEDGWTLHASGPCQWNCGFPAPMVHVVEMTGSGTGVLPETATVGIEGGPSLHFSPMAHARGAPVPPQDHRPPGPWVGQPQPLCGLAPCEMGISQFQRLSLQEYLKDLTASPQWLVWTDENPDFFPFAYTVGTGASTLLETVSVPHDGGGFIFSTADLTHTAMFTMQTTPPPFPTEDWIHIVDPDGPMELPPRSSAYAGNKMPEELMQTESAWTLITVQTQGAYNLTNITGTILLFQPNQKFPHPTGATLWGLAIPTGDNERERDLVVGSAYDGRLLQVIPYQDVAASASPETLLGTVRLPLP